MNIYMSIYKKYDLSLNGFLPEFQLKALPTPFQCWEQVAKNIPELIKNKKGSLRNNVHELPLLNWEELQPEFHKRAYSVLAIIASSYVWCEGFNNIPKILPKNVAIPLWHICKELGINPIATHASLDLFNWRLIDPSKGIVLDNLRSVYTMTGQFDEEWFYLIPVAVEKVGADILNNIIKILEWTATTNTNTIDANVCHTNNENILKSLKKIKQDLLEMKKILARMTEKCRPDFFYNTMRPYLAGWNNEHLSDGLIYEGISDEPQKFVGGSVTQSSLFQTIDAFCGITQNDEYFDKVKAYMPKKHREFIYHVKRTSNIKTFVQKHPKLKAAFESIVEELIKFRKVHYGLVHKYILAFIKKNNYLDDKGTGGTPLKSFLKCAIDSSKKVININNNEKIIEK